MVVEHSSMSPEDNPGKYVCKLSPELQKQAKDELNEDPERRAQDIEAIRKWLLKQPHINAKTDDWTILRFLRGCKFSLERTKEKMDMFYTCKTAVPEWFNNRDPDDPKMRELLKMGLSLPLEDHDPLNRKVIIIRWGVHNPSITSIDEVFRVCYVVGGIVMEEEEQWSITGMVQIADLAGSTPAHALQLTPSQIKKMVEIIVLLPQKSSGGKFVILGRFGIYDATKFSMDDIMRLSVAVYDVLTSEDEDLTVAGIVLLNDTRGSTVAHMASFTATFARKLAVFITVVPTLPDTVALNGSRIVIGKPGIRDPNTTGVSDFAKAMYCMLDVIMTDDEAVSVCGVNMVIDVTGLSFAHVAQMTPPIIKKMITIIQEGYPMRPKALHYINTPPAFDTIFSIFKSFMKEKMKKRIHLHGSDLSSLHKHIPPSILPKEYGGTNGTVEEITRYWLKKVDARKDWLKEDEKYKVDESKRPGKPKTSSDLFGLEGSFRKLNVD